MSLIVNLFKQIKLHMEARVARDHGIGEVLDRLNRTLLTCESTIYRGSQQIVHKDVLDHAIQIIPDGELRQVASALEAAKDHLHWRVDRGIFYPRDEDVGDGYRHGNMHCELIGPDTGVFPAEDFTLGLFLLTPRVLYRDHNHRAPELYITLTGPSGWRFNQGQWRDFDAGSVVWNASHAIHATRVYDQPFLAIYSWTKDVHETCSVVPATDWAIIERRLRNSEL